MGVIGLTGGIASGKTLVSDYMRKFDVDVIDGDVITHDLYAPGSEILKEIAGVFGEKYILADGNLDRTALREQVFSDMKNKESLERIVHPIIRREIMKALLQSEKDHQLLVLPLLIEGGYQCWCDELWLLRVDKKCQVDRLIRRDGITRKLAEEMIASQMPFDKKRRFADRIIDNRGSREKTFYQAEKSFFRFLKKFY